MLAGIGIETKCRSVAGREGLLRTQTTGISDILAILTAVAVGCEGGGEEGAGRLIGLLRFYYREAG